jgi:hypothetical protein
VQREHQLKLGTPGINGQTGGSQLTIRTQTVQEQVPGQGRGLAPRGPGRPSERIGWCYRRPPSRKESLACRSVVMPVRPAYPSRADDRGAGLP